MKANDLVVGDVVKNQNRAIIGVVSGHGRRFVRFCSGLTYDKAALTRRLKSGTLVAYNAAGVPLPLPEPTR